MKLLWILLVAACLTVACGNQGHDHQAAHQDNPEQTQAASDHEGHDGHQADSVDEEAEKAAIKLETAVMEAYVALQEALAADNFEDADKAADALVEKAEGEVKELAQKMADAADIDSLRTAFDGLSERLDKEHVPPGYILAYCPMAFNDTGAQWLQKGGKLMNPYFGAEMLHCGAVVKNGGEPESGE